MKKVFGLMFSRLFIIGMFILLQFAWIFLIAYNVSLKNNMVNSIFQLFALLLTIRIINNRSNPYFKLAWTFILLVVPVFGLSVYVVFGKSSMTKKKRDRMESIHNEILRQTKVDVAPLKELWKEDTLVARQSYYIQNWVKYPLYKDSETKYFSCGEEMFVDMMGAMERAKSYIFLEYFIIAKGQMLDEIVDLLEKKVKNGVLVRLIYDDVGSITTLPVNFQKKMQDKGIECAAFNPFLPLLSVFLNNRDHRKILVVDGQIGFTGGINLGDEYINVKKRFGYWKDTGVMIKGQGVWGLTSMFLEMWNSMKKTTENYNKYLPKMYNVKPSIENGYVQPYGDSPLDHENVGENIYLNIINNAKKYVYIFTPYLIVDNEMTVALCNASKCGVDVRVVTPGIPDKKTIFLLTQSYYEPLLRSGVRIYEYSPGFLHAKSFISDDVVATIGTVNLDYRSLYLHFECGAYLYKTQAVQQLKTDVLKTFEESKEITLEYCQNRNVLIRGFQGALKIFAPLL